MTNAEIRMQDQILLVRVRDDIDWKQYPFGYPIPEVLVNPRYPGYGMIRARWHQQRVLVSNNALRDTHLHIAEQRVCRWPIALSAIEPNLMRMITVVPANVIYMVVANPEFASHLIQSRACSDYPLR